MIIFVVSEVYLLELLSICMNKNIHTCIYSLLLFKKVIVASYVYLNMFPISLRHRLLRGCLRKKEGSKVNSATEAFFSFFREILEDENAPEELSESFGSLYITNYTGAQSLPLLFFCLAGSKEITPVDKNKKSCSEGFPLSMRSTLLYPISDSTSPPVIRCHPLWYEHSSPVAVLRLVVSLLSSFDNDEDVDFSRFNSEIETKIVDECEKNGSAKNRVVEKAFLCSASLKISKNSHFLSFKVPYSSQKEKRILQFDIFLDLQRERFPVLVHSLSSSGTASKNSCNEEFSPPFCDSALTASTHQLVHHIRKRESVFLCALANVVSEIIFFIRHGKREYESDDKRAAVSPENYASCPSKWRLELPVYQVRIKAHDNAETRLSILVPNVVETIIDSVISAKFSICQVGTLAIQWLFYISNDMLPLSLESAEALLGLLEHEKKSFCSFDTPFSTRSDVAKTFFVTLFFPASSPSSTSFSEDAKVVEKFFPLPSAVVHCLQGVSRSPSVVMCYIIRKWAPFFQKSVKQIREKWDGRQTQPFLGEVESDVKEEKVTISEKNLSKNEKKLFQYFVASLQKFRPIVQINPCFAAELHSMWRSLVLEQIK